jgi:hypothetical protein
MSQYKDENFTKPNPDDEPKQSDLDNHENLLLINNYVAKYYNDVPDATYKKVWEALEKKGIKHTDELDEAVRTSFNEFTQGII